MNKKLVNNLFLVAKMNLAWPTEQRLSYTALYIAMPLHHSDSQFKKTELNKEFYTE